MASKAAGAAFIVSAANLEGECDCALPRGTP
jgi:hypothetical protein